MAERKYSTNHILERHRVRTEILRLILTGRRKPGDRLVQQELAKQFGVAQSVVRESLLELQSTGLVHTVDNLGVFVSEMDADRLLEAYEVREMFEGLAARRCCQYANRSDLSQLRELAEDIYACGKTGDLARMGALDRKFHGLTLHVSQNKTIARLTDSYRLLGMAVQALRDIDTVHTEHLAIVAAIEDNRPDDAEHSARAHVRAARDAIRQQIADDGFQPQWVMDDLDLEQVT